MLKDIESRLAKHGYELNGRYYFKGKDRSLYFSLRSDKTARGFRISIIEWFDENTCKTIEYANLRSIDVERLIIEKLDPFAKYRALSLEMDKAEKELEISLNPLREKFVGCKTIEEWEVVKKEFSDMQIPDSISKVMLLDNAIQIKKNLDKGE